MSGEDSIGGDFFPRQSLNRKSKGNCGQIFPNSKYSLSETPRKKLKQKSSCERSPPGLSQLKCWPGKQRIPLRDKDHSRVDPQWVHGFLSHCFRMFPERFRSRSVFSGSKKNSSSFDKAPKIHDSVQLNSPDCFIVNLPSFSSDTQVMYSLVLPGTNVICNWPFLTLSCASLETAANFHLFLSVAITRKRGKLDSSED